MAQQPQGKNRRHWPQMFITLIPATHRASEAQHQPMFPARINDKRVEWDPCIIKTQHKIRKASMDINCF
ncbi:hypothetical protein QR680_003434 [Steinernema hermaphroditum]|uniref:Uncharacterized protein n=1 Tax=Steinernema hermaphroditum TaxID=289476 RepID=A0AA39LJR1_9BILA|nr:hypothetical protein QR680_003434 [Steinernema hermaphroditum]